MENFHEILMEMYPTPDKKPIQEKRPIYSLVNQATDKYIVNPKISAVHLSMIPYAYFLYESYHDLVPVKMLQNPSAPSEIKMIALGSIILSFVPMGLFYVGHRVLKSTPQHEASHAYRMRFYNFMRNLNIKKTFIKDGEKVETTQKYQGKDNSFTQKYLSLIEKLEKIGSEDSIKAGIARESAVILSLPYILKTFVRRGKNYSGKIDESLAKYDAEKLSGISVNTVSKNVKAMFDSLYEIRTDDFVPLNSMKKIEEKLDMCNLSVQDKKSLLELQRLEVDDVNASPEFKFYLEHPPIIVPKYSQLENILTR